MVGSCLKSFLLSMFLSVSIPASVTGQDEVMEGDIILKAADISVPRAETLPLSCVAAVGDDSSVEFSWQKRVDGTTTNVDVLPITQTYDSNGGSRYTISTILLCDLDFSNSATYSCVVQGPNNNVEYTQVIVHVPTSANFQLWLTGVGNCIEWVSSDSPGKLQSVVDHLETNILNDLCSTECHYNITNANFTCIGDSNAIIFSATIEHRQNVESLQQTADDVVNVIGAWKDTNASLTVSSQALSINSSCDIDSTTICGTDTSVGGGGNGVPLVPIVGGGLGGVAVVSVVVFVILVAVVIVKKQGKKRQAEKRAVDKKTEYTHFDPNMAYGATTGVFKGRRSGSDYVHFDPNKAYGANNEFPTSNPARSTRVDRNIAYGTSPRTVPTSQHRGSSCINLRLPPVQEDDDDEPDDYLPMNLNTSVYDTCDEQGAKEARGEEPGDVGPDTDREQEYVYDFIPGDRQK